MLQIRRILQLTTQGDSNRKISRTLHVSRDTISFYVNLFKNSGKRNDQLLSLTEEELSLLVYNDPPVVQSDWRYIDIQQRISSLCDELQKPKTTRMILWEEYRIQVPEGYSYTQFCEHLSRFLESRKAVMHFEHEPAAMMMFDFAGDKLPLVDTETGEITLCPVLVCVLPFSGYTYIEALITARREQLLKGLNNCLNYFGGVPLSVKTDNLGQFVKKSNRYEPVFDELANQWSLHYSTTLMASRVRKPRDKAAVESSVNSVYNRVYAPIRNIIFHSIEQMNMILREQLDKYNCRNFQRCDYSRRDRFLQYEKNILRALPEASFVPKHMVTAKVQRNYHVTLGEDGHHYSIPFQYIGKEVQLIYDADNVEVYLNQCRIATHTRNYRKGGYTTLADHVPPAHRHYSETRGWNKEYFIEQALKVGESTTAVITKILEQKIFVAQTYNSCLGVLRLKEKYGNDRLEAACQRAIGGYKLNYNIIKNILERNLDKAPVEPDLFFNIPEHENIRGPETYF
jgi:transposase